MLLRSLGSGVSGLKNFQTYLDVIGNNISNVSTTGFKKGRVNFQDIFSQTAQGATNDQNPVQIGLGAQTGSIDTVVSSGTPTPTNYPYDVAINGEGYFQVTDGGNTYYTRAGDFKLDETGANLVNAQGMTVSVDNAGADGNFNDVTSFTIDKQGNITGVSETDQQPVNLGRIQVYTFPNPAGLEKVGNSLFRQSQASGAADGTMATNGQGEIIQGSLEGSNVDLTEEMTSLIEAQRAYQANARTITTADQILQELVQLKR